jgi:hypothetical protein
MARTVVAIDDDDKRWLDEKAAEEGVPMTELVRRAIRRYREAEAEPTFQELVQRSKGIWRRGDGLAWQEKLRGEWDDRTP